MIADAPPNLAADPAAIIATQIAGKPVRIVVLDQTAFQREVRDELPDDTDPGGIVGLAIIGGDRITLTTSVYAGLFDDDPTLVGYSANILAHEIAHTTGITDERDAELRAGATEHRVLRLLGLRGFAYREACAYADWYSRHSPNLKR